MCKCEVVMFARRTIQSVHKNTLSVPIRCVDHGWGSNKSCVTTVEPSGLLFTHSPSEILHSIETAMLLSPRSRFVLDLTTCMTFEKVYIPRGQRSVDAIRG